ncbi:MAG: hypothetical protein EBV03_07395 [Proteobacteria bacterium]|nr:hypothetical protein [Pseudomonadota bacterium]
MSFDLCVFYTVKPHTNAEALKRYIAYCEEGDLKPYIEPSPKISEFVKELTALHPQIDDTPEDGLDECPWSIAFDLSEGHVIMPMVWSKADETQKIIVELAKKHDLVCFDPQNTKIITAPPGIHVQPKAWWKFW